ncbi:MULTISPECIES: nuclear transport factor 2 family protein [Niastella]|uniref:Nuclear transport factor 2 family protein n=1 Tax=Niastella soli TaxID=2821487 RepID=A0ABS3Z0V1_9BACT|nr:nuclear transport factor 2 family protein [Niastella soli]MBO9203780.1 nuclear transport factor 2 family protein [Niastella soli]
MIKRFIYLLVLTGIMNVAMAQSKEEVAVTAAVENLRKAMVDGDKTGLQNITAEQLSYGHSSGKVEDKATFVDNIVSGKSDFVTIELTNQTIAISGDAAIVRHTLSATTNDSGNPGSVKLNILLIWQKQKGKWKLLARQAVKVAS